jgi:FKBP-type peptidyl-prolyl cis-trans isomerase 2
MKHLGLLISGLGLFFWVACSNGNWKKGTDGTFEYQLFSNGKGTGAIEFGDVVRLDYNLMYEGTILESSFGKTPIEISVPAKEYRRELEEALLYAQSGDSLSVRIRFGRVSHLFEKYQANIPANGFLIVNYKIQQVTKLAQVAAQKDSLYAISKGFKDVASMQAERAGVMERSKSLTNTLAGFNQNTTVWQAHLGTEISYLFRGDSSQTALAAGDSVYIYYAATVLPELNLFDTNISRADRMGYVLGQDTSLIKALSQSVIGLRKGDRFLMRIPSELGYGAEGSEPVVEKNKPLGYYIEIGI